MNRYCPYCMEPLPVSGGARCPVCGGGLPYIPPTHHLMSGTVLSGKYLIGAAIGEGGFGITYIGRDMISDCKVAVKEYFPNGYANRNNESSNSLSERSTAPAEEFFAGGRSRFMNEARILARFPRESGIVNVSDFFEENNTAYIVMEYLGGKTLKQELKDGGPMSSERVMTLFKPIMEALRKIHAEGLIHRDISPDNIMLVGEKAVLLDFGAARNVSAAAGKSLSVVLKPGYAPEEQYRSRGSQGPWTDIYALCATMYKCLTGVTPTDSAQRVHFDDVKTPSELGVKNIPPEFERALMKGMSVFHNARYRTIDELADALNGRRSVPGISEDDIATRYLAHGAGGSDNGAADEMYPADAFSACENDPPREKPDAADIPKDAASGVPAAKGGKKRDRRKRVFTIAAVVLGIIWIAGLVIIVGDSIRTARYNAGLTSRAAEGEQTSYSNKIIFPDDTKRLAENEKLKRLAFYGCEFRDGAESFLGGIAALTNLTLTDCTGLRGMSFISGLEGASYITVRNCGVTDEMLEGVSLPRGLSILDVSGNSGVSSLDFAGNGGFPSGLTQLIISGTSVSDLSPLDGCGSLRRLKADNCLISGLFSELPNLDEFSAENNLIGDISALSRSERLTKLYLSKNRISDIGALAGCRALKTLSLDDNLVSSLLPLGEHSRLDELRVCRCGLTSLNGLENALGLRVLRAGGNSISDLGGIANCTVLESVDLSDNELSDVSLLEKSKGALRVLLAGGNELLGAAPDGLAKLEYLDISGCSVSKLPTGCEKLAAVFADNNRITSMKPLQTCSALEYVFLADNDIYYTGEFFAGNIKVCDLSGNHINYARAAGLGRSVMLCGDPIGENIVIPEDIAKRLSKEYGMDVQAYVSGNYSGGVKLSADDLLVVPYAECLDPSFIGGASKRVVIVDCPADRRLKLESELVLSGAAVEFMTSAEARGLCRESRDGVIEQRAV